MDPKRRHENRRLAALLLVVSLLLHAPLTYWVWQGTMGRPLPEQKQDYLVVELEPPPPDEPLPPEPVEEEDFSGQLVRIAKPKVPEKPEDADYLAEFDVKVPEESKSPLWEVLPEVLSPVWSKEKRYEQEDLVDLNMEKPSTGAEEGSERFPLDLLGRRHDRTALHAMTNKEGFADPVRASHSTQAVAGSPANDVLDVPDGDATLLNAREFLYGPYLNKINEMVLFYAQQTLDNADPESDLAKRKYHMELHAMLDDQGTLRAVRIVESCGMIAFDQALLEAWNLAGPFPPPPKGLISDDGFVHIDNWHFTVMIRSGGLPIGGFDLRGHERFPGLQTGDPMMQMR